MVLFWWKTPKVGKLKHELYGYVDKMVNLLLSTLATLEECMDTACMKCDQ